MNFFKRKNKTEFEGSGLVLFTEVQHAMQAEKVLKNGDYQVKLVAPPPELRKGCDLAVAVNLVERPGIERLLNEKHVDFIDISPMKSGSSELLELVKITDFGRWLMVKAGNMKLSFDKVSGEIVNTSGGGCPDIPLLHAGLVDRKLDEAPNPGSLSLTLCGLMLVRAFEESLAIWKGEK
jgi:hypothetical protein